MSKLIVGMADLKIASSPHILTTLGLGSCVGIALYDVNAKLGGLAHIMLPFSKDYSNQDNRAKFADTAIVDMINLMGRAGATRNSLVAKLAGGAHMFSSSSNNVLQVGKRNIEACKNILCHLSIPITANETGGTYGRTIELNTQNGSLYIRTVGHGEKIV